MSQWTICRRGALTIRPLEQILNRFVKGALPSGQIFFAESSQHQLSFQSYIRTNFVQTFAFLEKVNVTFFVADKN